MELDEIISFCEELGEILSEAEEAAEAVIGLVEELS